MIQGNYFNLASFSKSSILTSLKATQVSKSADLGNLSRCFLIDGPKLLVIFVIYQLPMKIYLTLVK